MYGHTKHEFKTRLRSLIDTNFFGRKYNSRVFKLEIFFLREKRCWLRRM